MKKIMKTRQNLFILFLCIIPMASSFASKIRLKELISIKGVRSNPIIGYGLVVGLNGTGDGNGEITSNSLKKILQKFGPSPEQNVASNNVAAVIVTAKLPPFARIGQKIDLTISSIGDAKSLAGGTLLVTPLKGGNGQIYAIASGPLSIGGLKKGSAFATTGTIPNGATIEKELDLDFDKKKSLRLSLNNPDFTTSARIEKVLNRELGGKYASSRDASTVDLIIPIHYQRKVVQLMAIIENFKVHRDVSAKIVINERTGTIVAGGDIFLRPVAIGHNDLTIEIKGDESGDNWKQPLLYVDKKMTLKELVNGLNAFGITPEDLISIFQALKRSGSLTNDIELI